MEERAGASKAPTDRRSIIVRNEIISRFNLFSAPVPFQLHKRSTATRATAARLQRAAAVRGAAGVVWGSALFFTGISTPLSCTGFLQR